MKKIHYIWICFSWFLIATMAYGQLPAESLPGSPGEKVILHTDRSVYIAGETILFTAGYQGAYYTGEGLLSKVIYTDLITWKGERILGVKTALSGGSVKGVIGIPGDLVSGNYYLAAYTRWMLNYGPGSFSYIPVTIVNSQTNKVIEGPASPVTATSKFVLRSREVQEDIAIEGLKDRYGRRAPVEFSIDQDSLPADGRWVVSVVKKGTIREQSVVSDNLSVPGPFRYFPETRGISLSGSVRDPETGNTVPDVRVYLSTTFDPLYFSSAVTHEDGSFLFTFPHYNWIHEFNLKAADPNGEPLEILVDAEYASHGERLPYLPFRPDSIGRSLLLDLARNVQLQEQFSNAFADSVTIPGRTFYGNPTRTLYIDDYIELDNMAEFFFELVYEVNVRKWGTGRAIFASGTSTLSNNPVLLLMDNIIVDDPDALLDLPCSSIERIEILWKGYVVNDKFFGGVVSLYSKDRDRAGLKNPGNSIFFDYSLLSDSQSVFPEYEREQDRSSRVPDRRNTLYWNPDVSASGDAPAKVRFYTGDAPGTYEVVVLSIGDDGEVVSGRSEFEVK